MWIVDRTYLIIFGVALAIVAVVGLMLLLPAPESTPTAAATATDEAATTPAPEPEPVVVAQPEPEPVVVAQPEPEPQPETAPVAPSPVTTVSSTPIVDGEINTGEYAHAMEASGFRVYWSNDENVLRVGLLSPGTGYVAFGLDPDQKMKGANIILGAVQNGQVITRDDVGTGIFSHGPDIDNGGTDDILAAAGREVNGQTTLEFIIPLDSGDPCDKPLQPGGTYKVLVAFSDTSDNFSVRHSQRGTGEIRLDDAP